MTTSSPTSAAAAQFRPSPPPPAVGLARWFKAFFAFSWALLLGITGLMFLVVATQVSDARWALLLFTATLFGPAISMAYTSLVCLKRTATLTERNRATEITGWAHVISISVGGIAYLGFLSL